MALHDAHTKLEVISCQLRNARERLVHAPEVDNSNKKICATIKRIDDAITMVHVARIATGEEVPF